MRFKIFLLRALLFLFICAVVLCSIVLDKMEKDNIEYQNYQRMIYYFPNLYYNTTDRINKMPYLYNP